MSLEASIGDPVKGDLITNLISNTWLPGLSTSRGASCGRYCRCGASSWRRCWHRTGGGRRGWCRAASGSEGHGAVKTIGYNGRAGQHGPLVVGDGCDQGGRECGNPPQTINDGVGVNDACAISIFGLVQEAPVVGRVGDIEEDLLVRGVGDRGVDGYASRASIRVQRDGGATRYG